MSDTDNRPLAVALTGGAGSGKSTVARRLSELGITVIDTDQLAREVVAPGESGLTEVVEAFGDQILDANGQLDRRALRERILDNAQDRQRLEAILHPRIMERLHKRLRQAEGPYAVAEIPLLLESGQTSDFQRIITVEAPMENRLARLMARDGVDEAAARQLIQSQASEAERRAAADWVIENDGDLTQLQAQVDSLDQTLRQARP